MTRLLLSFTTLPQGQFDVDGDEFFYLTRIRRHREGDTVEVCGIAGQRAKSKVVQIQKDRATLRIVEPLTALSTCPPLILLVAAPKRQLFDDIVRKTSEIGVLRLVPFIAERTVLRPGSEREERWRRIANESLRQCGRFEPLIVDPVQSFESAVERVAEVKKKFILHPAPGCMSLPTALRTRVDVALKGVDMAVAVGPEGGFCEAELALAAKSDFQPVSLGATILRVETAAIAASALCVAQLGGFESAF